MRLLVLIPFLLVLADHHLERKAYVGLGFADRSFAFDFNVALQDHVKYYLSFARVG